MDIITRNSDSINQIIRDIVREEISQHAADLSSEPVLITPDDAAKLCGVNKQTVLDLHDQRDANGFPSVRLGKRTIRIDKRRLNQWFATGGLSISA